jgi:hypothetical protein
VSRSRDKNVELARDESPLILVALLEGSGLLDAHIDEGYHNERPAYAEPQQDHSTYQ